MSSDELFPGGDFHGGRLVFQKLFLTCRCLLKCFCKKQKWEIYDPCAPEVPVDSMDIFGLPSLGGVQGSFFLFSFLTHFIQENFTPSTPRKLHQLLFEKLPHFLYILYYVVLEGGIIK